MRRLAFSRVSGLFELGPRIFFGPVTQFRSSYAVNSGFWAKVWQLLCHCCNIRVEIYLCGNWMGSSCNIKVIPVLPHLPSFRTLQPELPPCGPCCSLAALPCTLQLRMDILRWWACCWTRGQPWKTATRLGHPWNLQRAASGHSCMQLFGAST
jgi:hypothetical protein